MLTVEIRCVQSWLIEWNGYETRQTPLLYVFVDLKVHNVQKNSYHFDCIDCIVREAIQQSTQCLTISNNIITFRY